MATVKMIEGEKQELCATLPNGWHAAIFQDGQGWFAGVSFKFYDLDMGYRYVRRDHALRGLNRLFVSLGWDYTATR
jgi:hypothetical protein